MGQGFFDGEGVGFGVAQVGDARVLVIVDADDEGIDRSGQGRSVEVDGEAQGGGVAVFAEGFDQDFGDAGFEVDNGAEGGGGVFVVECFDKKVARSLGCRLAVDGDAAHRAASDLAVDFEGMAVVGQAAAVFYCGRVQPNMELSAYSRGHKQD